MKKDEEVPADILLLDSNEVRDREAICIVDTFIVNGKIDKSKKKATSLTKGKPKIINLLTTINLLLKII